MANLIELIRRIGGKNLLPQIGQPEELPIVGNDLPPELGGTGFAGNLPAPAIMPTTSPDADNEPRYEVPPIIPVAPNEKELALALPEQNERQAALEMSPELGLPAPRVPSRMDALRDKRFDAEIPAGKDNWKQKLGSIALGALQGYAGGGGLGGAIGGAVAAGSIGAFNPRMFNQQKRQRELAQVDAEINQESKLQDAAVKRQGEMIDVGYKRAQTIDLLDKPERERAKIKADAEKEANAARKADADRLRSIYNDLPEFDESKPEYKVLADQMRAAGLPTPKKTRQESFNLSVTPDGRAIKINTRTGQTEELPGNYAKPPDESENVKTENEYGEKLTAHKNKVTTLKSEADAKLTQAQTIVGQVNDLVAQYSALAQEPNPFDAEMDAESYHKFESDRRRQLQANESQRNTLARQATQLSTEAQKLARDADSMKPPPRPKLAKTAERPQGKPGKTTVKNDPLGLFR